MRLAAKVPGGTSGNCAFRVVPSHQRSSAPRLAPQLIATIALMRQSLYRGSGRHATVAVCSPPVVNPPSWAAKGSHGFLAAHADGDCRGGAHLRAAERVRPPLTNALRGRAPAGDLSARAAVEVGC